MFLSGHRLCRGGHGRRVKSDRVRFGVSASPTPRQCIAQFRAHEVMYVLIYIFPKVVWHDVTPNPLMVPLRLLSRQQVKLLQLVLSQVTLTQS